MKKSNQNNWAELLTQELTPAKLPIGDGWVTASELAKSHSVSLATIHRRMVALLLDGKIERFKGTKNGNTMVWYRPIPNKKHKLR
jgi:predicted HTH transcriptional regulator